MGFRITTWNVNGIRNPFGYQPWSSKKTFAHMFEILESDIVVMQECKIQKKDLKDDMVLVPGWDVFFSLPKQKKGYSGVAIYTRNATCAPIRVEEGITGLLCPPNSSTSYYNLPEETQVGGYPTPGQLSESEIDAATLDAEGRCMILEFPAFVLIGVYFPANSSGDRDDFRISFLIALDARIRNLVALGKRVVLTGDLNISREEIDAASAEEQMRKNGISGDEYISASPCRRMFHRLLVDGKGFGSEDERREKGVLWDICRSFHPGRKGMYTCWEQKINARPGNYGSRIDYVLCSDGWKDWFYESNIQEGLMGSDHCPVYAIIKDKVQVGDTEVHINDIMNPEGMFKDGIRLREWCQKDLLPASAKLIPEFDRRRSIRDMFAKKPSRPTGQSSASTTAISAKEDEARDSTQATPSSAFTPSIESSSKARPSEPITMSQTSATKASSSFSQPNGRMAAPAQRPTKRSKSSSTKAPPTNSKKDSGRGQSSLMGFFKPKTPTEDTKMPNESIENNSSQAPPSAPPYFAQSDPIKPPPTEPLSPQTTTNTKRKRTLSNTSSNPEYLETSINSPNSKLRGGESEDKDPIAAKESWSKLLSKRVVPRCEHDEPCVSMLTKKPGVNCGRSFFVCSRPMGPSGQKEKGTEWRCGTFIWSSDWGRGESVSGTG